MTEAADALMADAPLQALRVEAAEAYAVAKQLMRAREVALGVARDPSAPKGVRADAYALLMKGVGREQGDWSLAESSMTNGSRCDQATQGERMGTDHRQSVASCIARYSR